MAFDEMKGGDPWGPICRSCKRPIDKDEPMENIRFENDPDRSLEDMNGPYHTACAGLYQSLARWNRVCKSFGF